MTLEKRHVLLLCVAIFLGIGLSLAPPALAGKNKSQCIVKELKSQEFGAQANTNELRDFVERGDKLVEGVTYHAVNGEGRHYEVTFAHEIHKAIQKGHAQTIKKLLSALFLSNTGKAGIKPLSSVGKHIVEIKTIMHGHYRLIGCADGNRIEIKKFMDLPESVSSYSKLIPSNLCTK